MDVQRVHFDVLWTDMLDSSLDNLLNAEYPDVFHRISNHLIVLNYLPAKQTHSSG